MSLPVFVRELLGKPEIVMLLRPVEIDLAAAHGLECTFHPEGADIDVAKDQRDEQNCDDGMYDLRQLHLGNVSSEKGNSSKKPDTETAMPPAMESQ